MSAATFFGMKVHECPNAPPGFSGAPFDGPCPFCFDPDLVAHLRERAEGGPHRNSDRLALHKAADEIERLRALLVAGGSR